MKYEDAMIYASGIVLLTAINGVLVNHFFMAGFHNGLKVRVAICSNIYRKVNPNEFDLITNKLCFCAGFVELMLSSSFAFLFLFFPSSPS